MTMRFFRYVAREGYPIVTPLIRDIYRTRTIFEYGLGPLARSIAWYLRSKEYTNFTYAISEKSKKYLTNSLASFFNVSRDKVASYLHEVENDQQLAEHFRHRIPETPDRYFADLPVQYGRRIGWYATVRLSKPKLIIESGIDRGVGTCLLAAAILRNAAEGAGGRVVGLDINPYAGRYVTPPYKDVVELVYGDALQYLSRNRDRIDIFIHDSNHSAEHEAREFETVAPSLSEKGLLLTDNAEVTDCLYEFAARRGWEFTYWQEEVVNHLAMPGGIGIARPR